MKNRISVPEGKLVRKKKKEEKRNRISVSENFF